MKKLTSRITTALFAKIKPLISYFANVAGVLASITVVIVFLDSKNIKILDYVSTVVKTAFTSLQIGQVPSIIWFVLILGVIYLILISRKINIVAGEFKENFDHGLVNWEYGGEGWTIERGEKGYELSVTNSGDGGITNFGLWDNYVFSFECKLLKDCVGWIVRATDRERYVMIQLSCVNSTITLNPHYHVPSGWYVQSQPLNCSKKLTEVILAQEWINVKVIVFGNTIDVFINSERVLNHHIPDPLRLLTQPKSGYSYLKGNSETEEELKKTQLESFSFPSGKVGFRCFGQEHCHIRSVRLKPLYWNNNQL